jgi:predicted DNA-binding transcriptional regulator AlpA
MSKSAQAPQIERRFGSEVEAARIAGISPRTLQKWRLFNRGPRWYRVGGSVRYDLTELVEWIKSHAAGGGEAA